MTNATPATPATNKPALLMTGKMMPLIVDQLNEAFDVHHLPAGDGRGAFIAEHGAKFVAVAYSGGHGIPVNEAFFAGLPNVKIIASFGVGYDTIDAAAAARHGVIVTNTPDVLTEEVADTTLGLLLMTVREFSAAEQHLRAGKWPAGEYPLTHGSLRDRSVGIVGMGRIGKAIGKRIEAFGMPVSYYSRRPAGDVAYAYHADLVSLAAAVDTLVVIVPGGPETKNLINRPVLEALGPRGVLINVARGSVVDEAALKSALRDGTIFAAGLDVMWNEPNIDPELMTLPRTVLLPHVGSASQWTRNAMGQRVVDNLIAYREGRSPLSPVAETPFKAW